MPAGVVNLEQNQQPIYTTELETPETFQAQCIKAIERDDSVALQALITSNPKEVEKLDRRWPHALHIATSFRAIQCLDLLLRLTPLKLAATNKDGLTTLGFAITANYLPTYTAALNLFVNHCKHNDPLNKNFQRAQQELNLLALLDYAKERKHQKPLYNKLTDPKNMPLVEQLFAQFIIPTRPEGLKKGASQYFDDLADVIHMNLGRLSRDNERHQAALEAGIAHTVRPAIIPISHNQNPRVEVTKNVQGKPLHRRVGILDGEAVTIRMKQRKRSNPDKKERWQLLTAIKTIATAAVKRQRPEEIAPIKKTNAPLKEKIVRGEKVTDALRDAVLGQKTALHTPALKNETQNSKPKHERTTVRNGNARIRNQGPR